MKTENTTRDREGPEEGWSTREFTQEKREREKVCENKTETVLRSG